MSASFSFNCPECDKPLHSYLNISAMRKADENQLTCDKCKRLIEIVISVLAHEVEP